MMNNIERLLEQLQPRDLEEGRISDFFDKNSISGKDTTEHIKSVVKKKYNDVINNIKKSKTEFKSRGNRPDSKSKTKAKVLGFFKLYPDIRALRQIEDGSTPNQYEEISLRLLGLNNYSVPEADKLFASTTKLFSSAANPPRGLALKVLFKYYDTIENVYGMDGSDYYEALSSELNLSTIKVKKLERNLDRLTVLFNS